MANDTTITAKTYKASELFQLGKFTVPWHQRYYDWEKTNVLNLLLDIDDAITKKRSCYFLGSVMIIRKPFDHYEINDGQQRFVTLSLICARLCQVFKNLGDEERERQGMNFLFKLEPDHSATMEEAENLPPRITPPAGDESTYNQIIQFRRVKNGKLGRAWDIIDQFFSGKSFQGNIQKYGDFWDFMHEKLEIACLDIPTTIDPNSIFEALNFRGKQLDDFDLLRNYLYSFFNSEETKQYRKTVRDSLEKNIRGILPGKKPEEYARCHFLCEFGFSQKNQFYREARKNIETSIQGMASPRKAKWVFDFVEEFTNKSNLEIFRVLTTPNANDQFVKQFLLRSGTNSDKRNFRHFLLDVANYTVAVPIVFSLLKRYLNQSTYIDAKNFAKIAHNQIKTITSFVAREALIQTSFRPTLYEKDFAGYAARIVDAPKNEIDLLRWLIRDHGDSIIDDRKFVPRILLTEYSSETKIKRFLLAMGTYQQSSLLGANPQDFTVEHILPKSPIYAGKWGFSPEEHRGYSQSLGNLTLLTPQDNKSGTEYNDAFDNKKDTYRNSTLLLTNGIAENYGHWSPEAVKKREKELAKLAARTWSFPR